MTRARFGRLKLTGLALIWFAPLILATWRYITGNLVPESRSNFGALIEPVIELREVLPASRALVVGDGKWLMVLAVSTDCGDACREALFRLRQTRLMLGREMDRVIRVFLHGETAPDTLFIEEEHAGLETFNDNELATLLEGARPGDQTPGGIYLVDPLGNLVMYFPPELDPREMVDDIEHLLELSSIG